MEVGQINPDNYEVNSKVLGLAVVAQAIEDIQGPYPLMVKTRNEGEQVRGEAIKFLIERNEDLEFWCELAELNMDAVVERAKGILSRKV